MNENIDTTKVAEENTEFTREDYDDFFRQNDENSDGNAQPRYTIEYILGRIEKIHDDSSHISQALTSLQSFEPGISPNGGEGDAARANAVLDIVKCRETTLQKELDLLERMYEDLKMAENSPDHRERLLMEFVSQVTLPPNLRVELFEKYLNSID